MRRFCTGLLAAVLALGLLAAAPAQAKVYKMAPEERAAALKEKKAKRAQARKAGKPAPGQDQGGWVEVKPGEKIAKKNKKPSSKVDEIAAAAEKKGQKKPAKAEAAAPEARKGKKAKKIAEEPLAERKGKKSAKGKKGAERGDRLVGRDAVGERKVSASSAEVRRTGAEKPAGQMNGQPGGQSGGQADDLSGYSVSRPGQGSGAPELRHEVQSGPVDSSRPLGTEPKGGEGRF